MAASSKDFITLADLYVAYRKAKVEAFYENTHFHAIAFTEYEQDLQKNLTRLYGRLTKGDASWACDLDFIGDYAYLPKSVDCTSWNNESDGHFRALDPITDWKQRFRDAGRRANARLRLVIRPTVDYQIVSALWIIKVGHLFDGEINEAVSHGNRLRRSYSEFGDARSYASPLNLTATGLFVPYFSAYRNWRENGLTAMEDALRKGKSILAITMDVEKFYHRVSPKFLLRRAFLESIDLELTPKERALTKALLKSIDFWYRSTPDFRERPQGAIPVGLSASKIISNVLLAEFDNSIVSKLKPIYYGRYVDDIFLVFENDKGLTSAAQVADRLVQALTPCLERPEIGNAGSTLKLLLPYAKDSEIIFAGEKHKVFALSSEHGLDLIQHIREQIRIQSSEYRLLPSVPYTGADMASRALLATPNASLQVDALRKADVVSVRRLGLSLLIRDVEAYSADLRPDSWTPLRKEFYGLVKRHVLTPTGFFDFFGYIPRVFGLMLSCHDLEEAEQLILDLVDIGQVINDTTTLGEGKARKYFERCLSQYALALYQAGIQAATEKTIDPDRRYLRTLKGLSKLDDSLRVPRTLPILKRRVREVLLADWGRRPYKDYWYLDQEHDETGPPVPRQREIKHRLAGIRRFRTSLTDLRTPHWPALAFPTRPLRLDEIILVAPMVLSNPELFKQSIMALRGARVASLDSLGIVQVDSNESSRTHFSAPGKRKDVIRVAVTSFETNPKQWSAAASGKQDRSLGRYRKLNALVNRILTETKRPDYIVFPELSIPLRWALRVARKLAMHDISLLAGVEYHRDKATKRLRNDCLVSLVTRWPGYRCNVVNLQPKFLPAHEEKEELVKLRLGKRAILFEPTGAAARPTVYTHRGFCFSVLICSDLTNISNRDCLRGEIDALFALEWNKDTGSFASLVEASASDLHAFIVQANNRLYGDSRIRAPAKETYSRDVVQVKGGVSDYYVLGEIDYLQLRKEQRRKQAKTKFKPVPIGYRMSQYRKIEK